MPAEPSVSPADTPTCDYCGSLAWTVEKYGRVTHKESCPHRTDPWHQGDPGAVSPADTIRRALEPRKPGEHHSRCAARSRGDCDCYAKWSNLAFAALDELLAVGERDKAELSGLRVEFSEWVKAIHEAFAGREVDPQSDGPERIRRLARELQQAEERGERDRRQIAQLTEALGELTDAGYEHASGHDGPGDLEAAVQKAARILSPLSPEWFAAADAILNALPGARAVLADEEDAP